MTQALITVHGKHESFHTPERATVALTVQLVGPDKAAAYEGALRSADEVSRAIEDIKATEFGGVAEVGAVTWYSRQAIRTHSYRPWNRDSDQLPIEHSATVTFAVKFRDFDALPLWLDYVTAFEGVTVQGIGWTLTKARHEELVLAARTAAVTAARDKALAYATAAGLNTVVVAAIADTGMLNPPGAAASESLRYGAPAAAARGMVGGAAGPPDVPAVVPEDVRVAASVDAQYVAS